MPTYYRQHKRVKKQIRTALIEEIKSHIKQMEFGLRRELMRGIPDFELRTPNNPNIVQQELIKFAPMQPDDMPSNTRWDREFRRLDREEKQMERVVREHNLKNGPNFQKVLDSSEYTEAHALASFHKNQNLRKKHGRNGKTHVWNDCCNEDDYSLPLSDLDRLALGDTRIGEKLFH